jgi:hypothetical protein
MIDSEFPAPQSHAGRRRIATPDQRLRRRCPLADATSIGFAIAWRGWAGVFTRRTTATSDDSESTIYRSALTAGASTRDDRRWRRRGSRQIASPAIRGDIFERPSRRSRKTIGTSTTRKPAHTAR